jgi:3'-phosphoadenosine 5'-phosphosulfate sulfotransferase (PAPS reductase)/FAD synthetase
MSRVDLISVSGGKDSQAVLELALERGANIMAVFADTGHEHQLTYDHLETIERETGVSIRRVRADFTERMAGKRAFIQNGGRGKPGWAEAGISQERIDAAVEMIQPTGNPFLDMALWKGRFPSTKARFCTEELKVRPIEEQVVLPLLREGHEVWSWQGVRADESLARRDLPEQEWVDPGITVYRPIITWTAADVFAYLGMKGRTVNPLYTMGMGRVGCMPCINCRKDELRQIAARFPEEIERVAEWEKKVSVAAKRGSGTLLPTVIAAGRGNTDVHYTTDGIHATVEWSKTARGGKQYDFVNEPDVGSCSSNYGLCE